MKYSNYRYSGKNYTDIAFSWDIFFYFVSLKEEWTKRKKKKKSGVQCTSSAVVLYPERQRSTKITGYMHFPVHADEYYLLLLEGKMWSILL